MRRFRTHWLAVFGALVILSLSLSSAFGARPPAVSHDETTNVGQQVSTFVHSLLAGDEEDGDQDESEECDTDSDEETGDEETGDEETGDEETGDEETGDEETGDEETGDEETGDCAGGTEDGDSDEGSDDEDSEEQESQNHGQCVSGVAHGDETGENGTHGWAVSLAARVTCWLEALADENGDEDSDESEDTDVTAAAADKPHGKSEAAQQRKADRGSGKPTWAGANAPGTHGHGGGHGKGGNH
jgi:hypothetical protein